MTVTIGEHSVIPYHSRIIHAGHFSWKSENISSPHFSAPTKANLRDSRILLVLFASIILRNVGVADMILAPVCVRMRPIVRASLGSGVYATWTGAMSGNIVLMVNPKL